MVMNWLREKTALQKQYQPLHRIVILLGCVLGVWRREQRPDVGHALVDLILVHFDWALPNYQIVSKRLWIIELQPVVGHQFPCFRHIASAARHLKVINID